MSFTPTFFTMGSWAPFPLIIDHSSLPDISKSEMNFYDTSFFCSPTRTLFFPKLPSPALVRKESQARFGGSFQHLGDVNERVEFKHLNLLVKFGHPRHVSLEEALVMRTMKQLFPGGEVPVPEVFGWRVDKGQNFVYMSLIKGQTLWKAWSSLTQMDKKAICAQLSQIVAALRQIRQPSPDRLFIGSITRGSVQDRYFDYFRRPGPLFDLLDFHGAVRLAAFPPREYISIYDRYQPPLLLPATCDVYFTNGDLDLQHIIIAESGPPRIVGIVDWQQAGWYPEYWEYCKLRLAACYNTDWRESGWVESIMTPYEREWKAFYTCWVSATMRL
ncbi:kinase-like protein [Nemania sp. FL0031]|nr:kinase-like protein [Nemania sp. FL0031]